MNNDYNSEDWSRLEARWQEHYRRIDEIASREATVPQAVPTRWWRYVAAAVAVAVVAVSAVVWLRPQQPAPAAPMLAMNGLEVPADPVSIPADEPEAQPAQSSMAAPKAQPQREEVAMPSEPQEAAPAPEQEEHEFALIGIPTDDSYVSATIEGTNLQTYVRCNSLCDAREILTQTKELL